MNPSLTPIVLSNTSKKSTFSPAVRVGDLLFISGMTAVNDEHQIVGEDIVEQARFIYQKMDKVLRAAGLGFDSVIETHEYVTTLKDYDKTAEVRREVFNNGPYPAATGVQVAGLVRPGALIEISAIAYAGAEKGLAIAG
ncbi:RidA family protein [Allopusillimonas soli]|uniref:RidA family protein n=1 Tax=Allopusillimonas soli TaxID=659016 RepID=A0A853FD40_9BURK|nr:RidA family protein [Allopusillimonas soli]NYT38725.1 RidA family protein [Allopusillimonas soli]TEA71580.1 RidA family protein [Allopusillimonas soli]